MKKGGGLDPERGSGSPLSRKNVGGGTREECSKTSSRAGGGRGSLLICPGGRGAAAAPAPQSDEDQGQRLLGPGRCGFE